MSKVNGISKVLRLTLFTGIGLAAIGVPASHAGDPFVAGGRSDRPVALAASAADRAIAHGRQLAAALGLPGASQRAARIDDRFEHRTYDEVTSLDAAGREVAIARFETDGTLAMAVVLGWQPGRGRKVDRSGAEARALGLARAAGLDVAGRPAVLASAGSGGWSITWPRFVDGAPVRGDGVRVALWADGSLHGLSRIQRPLAAAPGHPIASGSAHNAATDWVAGHYGAAAVDLRVAAVERAWVAPNDTFAPNGLDAPAETLRLAWVVRFDASGALAERLRSVEAWLDAGNGNVIGGDIVE